MGFVAEFFRPRTFCLALFLGCATAVHAADLVAIPQLGLRIPIGDVLVVRLGLGWLHTVAQSVAVGMEDDSSVEASPLEAIVSDWIARYGFGPTLRLSVGLHFG